MKNTKIYSLRTILPTILLVGFVVTSTAHGVDLNGNWNYNENDNGVDKTSSVSQRYGAHFSRSLTTAASMAGSVSYNRNWVERSGTNTTLLPQLSFSVTNDIFRSSLSGYMSENTDANDLDRSQRNWDANIGSAWRKKLWPSLSLQYGEQVSESDITFGSGTSRRDTTRYGANVDWDILLGKIFYGFNGNTSEDSTRNNETKSANHFAKFSTSKSFFQDRVSVSFAQQYNEGRQQYQSTLNPSGFSLRQKGVVQAMAVQDNTPLATVMGADIPAMRDSNLTVAAPAAEIVIPPLEDVNIGFQVSAIDPEVDLIYLYTREDLVALSVNTANIVFSLYVVPDPLFPNVWTQVALPAGSVSYNAANRRFALSIPQQQREFVKLVVDASLLAASIPVTEIELFEKEYTPEVVTSNKRYATDVGVGYQVSDAVDLGYSFSYNEQKASSGSSTDQTSHSVSLSYDPMTTWSTSFAVSESTSNNTNTEESKSRAYSLSSSWAPLTTLRFQSGLSRSEGYSGGVKTSTSHTLNLNTIADIYRDLSSSLDVNYSTSKAETTGNKSDTLGTNLRLTARLNPRLTVSFSERYSRTTSTSNPATDSDNSDISLSWRPSDVLSFSSSASYARTDNSEDSIALSLSMNLVPTSKTQLGFTYGYAHSVNASENYGVNWSWLMSNNLSFSAYGRYNTSDAVGSEDSWNIGTQLSARVSGL